MGNAAREGSAGNGLGLLGCEQILRSVAAVDRASDLIEQAAYVVVPRRGQRMK